MHTVAIPVAGRLEVASPTDGGGIVDGHAHKGAGIVEGDLQSLDVDGQRFRTIANLPGSFPNTLAQESAKALAKGLMQAGVNVTIASDFFVSEPDIPGAIYCGMTRLIPQWVYELETAGDTSRRRVTNPDEELNPGDYSVLPPLEERASLENMIAATTLNGAYANFLDEELGSIEVGKLADLVVLDRNLFEIDVEQIPEAQIEMTFFEGKQVFTADSK